MATTWSGFMRPMVPLHPPPKSKIQPLASKLGIAISWRGRLSVASCAAVDHEQSAAENSRAKVLRNMAAKGRESDTGEFIAAREPGGPPKSRVCRAIQKCLGRRFCRRNHRGIPHA